MIGCCNQPSAKFMNQEGEVDNARLAAIIEKMKEKGGELEYVNYNVGKITKCQCICHRDGFVCLC